MQLPHTSSWRLAMLLFILAVNRLSSAAAVPVTSSQDILYYNLTELLPVGTLVGSVPVDSGLSSILSSSDVLRLQFGIISGNRQSTGNGSYFVISSTTGILRTAAIISRNAICPYQTTCELNPVIQVLPVDLLRIVSVTVRLIDVNDAKPTFPPPGKVTINVPSTLTVGSAFPLPAADDRDSPNYGIQSYSVTPLPTGNEIQPFRVRTTTLIDGSTDLQLVLVASITGREGYTYRLSVLAIDGGSPPLTGSLAVDVIVAPHSNRTGDNSSTTGLPGPPRFDQQAFTANVSDGAPVGTVITQLSASQTGSGGKIAYSFDSYTLSVYGQIFGIGSASGTVQVTGKVSLSQLASGSSSTVCSLVIVAVDTIHPSLAAAYVRLLITVFINNQNSPGSAPVVSLTVVKGSESGTGAENGSIGAVSVQLANNSPVGTPLVYVSAAPSGGDFSNVVSSISCLIDSGFFQLLPVVSSSSSAYSSSSVYVLSPAVVFDRGHQIAPYAVTVTCFGGSSPQQRVNTTRLIRVSIVDAGPSIVIPRSTSQQQQQIVVLFADKNAVGDVITTIRSNTTDTGPASIPGFSLVDVGPNLLPVASSPTASIGFRSGVVVAGVVYRFDRNDASKNRHLFVVTATDAGIVPLSSTAILAVNVVESTPYFSQPAYAFTVQDGQPVGKTVGLVAAVVDLPSSGCWYSLLAATADAGLFSIDSTSGLISTASSLSAVDASVRQVAVQATNLDRPRSSSVTNVTVFIVSSSGNSNGGGSGGNSSGAVLNFKYPNATNNMVQVPAGSPTGTFVGRIAATATPSGSQASLQPIRYSLVAGNGGSLFVIDDVMGVIRTATANVGSPGTVYTLAIAATLQSGTGNRNTATAALVVIVVNPGIYTTPTVGKVDSSASSENGSSWWAENGTVVIAAASCVTAFIVATVVVIVCCVAYRLRKQSSRLEKQKAAANLAHASAISDLPGDESEIPRPLSRASTTLYLDDLCSCSRRSSRHGAHSNSSNCLDDSSSLDGGFGGSSSKIGVSGAGSSSSGIYSCRSGRSDQYLESHTHRTQPLGSHLTSRDRSSRRTARRRGSRRRRVGNGADHRSAVKGRTPVQKYDSDSGVEASFYRRRQYTPSPGHSREYRRSTSGGSGGQSMGLTDYTSSSSGGGAERRVERQRRSQCSSTSPSGSQTTSRSSITGSERSKRSRREITSDQDPHGVDQRVDTRPSSTHNRLHSDERQPSPTHVLMGRRSLRRRSPTYRFSDNVTKPSMTSTAVSQMPIEPLRSISSSPSRQGPVSDRSSKNVLQQQHRTPRSLSYNDGNQRLKQAERFKPATTTELNHSKRLPITALSPRHTPHQFVVSPGDGYDAEAVAAGFGNSKQPAVGLDDVQVVGEEGPDGSRYRTNSYQTRGRKTSSQTVPENFDQRRLDPREYQIQQRSTNAIKHGNSMLNQIGGLALQQPQQIQQQQQQPQLYSVKTGLDSARYSGTRLPENVADIDAMVDKNLVPLSEQLRAGNAPQFQTGDAFCHDGRNGVANGASNNKYNDVCLPRNGGTSNAKQRLSNSAVIKSSSSSRSNSSNYSNVTNSTVQTPNEQLTGYRNESPPRSGYMRSLSSQGTSYPLPPSTSENQQLPEFRRRFSSLERKNPDLVSGAQPIHPMPTPRTKRRPINAELCNYVEQNTPVRGLTDSLGPASRLAPAAVSRLTSSVVPNAQVVHAASGNNGGSRFIPNNYGLADYPSVPTQDDTPLRSSSRGNDQRRRYDGDVGSSYQSQNAADPFDAMANTTILGQWPSQTNKSVLLPHDVIAADDRYRTGSRQSAPTVRQTSLSSSQV